MFDFAKALVLSNLRTTHPGATDAELRVLLFDRLYGNERDPAEHGTTVVASAENDSRCSRSRKAASCQERRRE